MELEYSYPLYRPPSESNSIIFQVTLGCSFNQCSFCNMYRTKEYVERPWQEIKMEIDMVAKSYPETERIFLADGDALNLSTDRLIQILEYLYQKFRFLKRVSSYAMPKNLLQKSDSELKKLHQVGLKMLYVGIESGNDTILKKVTKGATHKNIIQSCKKARNNGYILSCMIILGLGGVTYTKQHISDTAKIISEISPDFVGALTLQLEEGVYDEFLSKFKEPFLFLNDGQILDELEQLVSNIYTTYPIIFRANHASNVYSIKGTLPQDKAKILELIKHLKGHPELLKPKVLRRF